MQVIGITGQVGSGKSEILNYLKEEYKCLIIKSDEVAHVLREPGGSCYDRVADLVGRDCLNADGSFNRAKMAERIFNNKELLLAVNSVLHPAVMTEIETMIRGAKAEGVCDYVFVESALMFESGLDRLCGAVWYIYVRDEVRRERLKASRGYSDEKIDEIMKKQMSDEELKKHCKWVIDNSDELSLTKQQIALLLR